MPTVDALQREQAHDILVSPDHAATNKRNFHVREDTFHRGSAVCRLAFSTGLGSARQPEGRGRRSGHDRRGAGTPSVLASSWPLALSRIPRLSFVWLLPRLLWLSPWRQLVLRRPSPSALGPSSPSLVTNKAFWKAAHGPLSFMWERGSQVVRSRGGGHQAIATL
jgi:hypothetical protein